MPEIKPAHAPVKLSSYFGVQIMAVKPVYFAESQVKVGSANLFACLMCVEIKTS